MDVSEVADWLLQRGFPQEVVDEFTGKCNIVNIIFTVAFMPFPRSGDGWCSNSSDFCHLFRA